MAKRLTTMLTALLAAWLAVSALSSGPPATAKLASVQSHSRGAQIQAKGNSTAKGCAKPPANDAAWTPLGAYLQSVAVEGQGGGHSSASPGDEQRSADLTQWWSTLTTKNEAWPIILAKIAAAITKKGYWDKLQKGYKEDNSYPKELDNFKTKWMRKVLPGAAATELSILIEKVAQLGSELVQAMGAATNSAKGQATVQLPEELTQWVGVGGSAAASLLAADSAKARSTTGQLKCCCEKPPVTALQFQQRYCQQEAARQKAVEGMKFWFHGREDEVANSNCCFKVDSWFSWCRGPRQERMEDKCDGEGSLDENARKSGVADREVLDANMDLLKGFALNIVIGNAATMAAGVVLASDTQAGITSASHDYPYAAKRQ